MLVEDIQINNRIILDTGTFIISCGTLGTVKSQPKDQQERDEVYKDELR